MQDISTVRIADIINSLSEGVYVCDLDRRITYWSESAERITGWSAADVVGRQCHDDVLCHIDKDGHALCGEEHCPLHRSMVTGVGSNESLLVFAQAKSGDRVPMHVRVAPIRSEAGEVIGGVETFRDASEIVHDLQRARAIQRSALQHELPDDDRLAFTTHYIPHDIIGGDFYAIQQLDQDRYGIMLADVMGHGLAAALYTMHLSQLWERYHATLLDPAKFAAELNTSLIESLQSDHSFATAVCGFVDLKNRVFRFAGAGGPPVLLMHPDGTHEELECSGFPLAMVEEASYDDLSTDLQPGDRLLLFSDGALEITDSEKQMLGMEGLLTILKQQGYPESGIQMEAFEEALLRYSNSIRLPDDLTIVELHYVSS